MAATQATTGFRTLLYIGTTPSATPTLKVSEIRNVSGPNRSINFADATHMESPNGYDEFVATFKSGGDVTCEMNYLPADANQNELQVAFEVPEVRKFWIVYPSGTKRASFTAWVSALGDVNPHNDVMRRNVTLKITGAVVFEAHP